MEPDIILLEYRAMRWDGTMEGADRICELLDWLYPWWEISKHWSPRESFLKLTIHETTPGSNAKSWVMNKNQLLVCYLDDNSRYHPEKVIDDD